MKRAVWIVAAALAVAGGCKKKSSSGGAGKPGAAAPAVDSAGKAGALAADTVWGYAPAGATWGMVMGDGAGGRTLGVANDFLALLGKQPAGQQAVAKLMAKLPPDLPRDAAALEKHGIDVAKGAGMFFTAGADPKPLLVILPVGDVAAFRTLTHAKTSKDGDLDIDDLSHGPDPAKLVCALVGPRYLCAPTPALIREAAKPHDSPLAKAVKALPPAQRGDLEFFMDAKGVTDPEFVAAMRKAEPVISDVTALSGMMRIQKDGLVERWWLAGKPGVKAASFVSLPPPAAFTSTTKDAASVMRMHFDPRLALAKAPPHMPIGTVDLRSDLLDQLTGDLQLVSAGKSILGTALMLGIQSPDKVKGAIGALCGLAKLRAPMLDIQSDAEACTIVPPPQLMMPLAMTGLGGPMKIRLSVEDKMLVARDVSYDPAQHQGSAADAAGSPETAEILSAPATFAGWSRGFDFVGQMPPALVAQMMQSSPPEASAKLDLVSWLGLHVYDAGLSVSFTADGIHALFRVTTFGGDPPEARAAYEAALDKRMANDTDGYHTALVAIEKKYPGTVAARQAALVRIGYPPVSAAIGILAAVAIPAFLKYQGRAKQTEARVELAAITSGAIASFEASGALPKSHPLTPAQSCCDQGGKCQPSAAAFSDWADLRFSIDDPHLFQYQLETSGDAMSGKIVARAVGDPGCKGHPVTLELETDIVNHEVHRGRVHPVH